MHTLLTRLVLGGLAAFFCSTVLAEDTPKLNTEKYPQDTPKAAMQSLIKVLEARDFEYWISWLITPADRERIVKKHGSLLAASIYNADDRHTERIKLQREMMQKMLSAGALTEGEDQDVKWARYKMTTPEGERSLQFEKQSDGRWCMNIRSARAAVSPPPEKK
ncbi:MAG TPA: hypothetical protein VGP72_08255 [Planctomycetota bacterium]|jgi:hypothetical protein